MMQGWRPKNMSGQIETLTAVFRTGTHPEFCGGVPPSMHENSRSERRSNAPMSTDLDQIIALHLSLSIPTHIRINTTDPSSC